VRTSTQTLRALTDEIDLATNEPSMLTALEAWDESRLLESASSKRSLWDLG
jgi:hypothetical protein